MVRAYVCASTGNTAASAAAYAARAGASAVVVPAGKIALGKRRTESSRTGADSPDPGNFDAALKLSKRIAGELEDVTLVKLDEPGPYRGPEDRSLRGR